jgi:hypothetical protein
MRYKKQKPKFNSVTRATVQVSEEVSKACFTISGLNRAGKDLVKLMNNSIKQNEV